MLDLTEKGLVFVFKDYNMMGSNCDVQVQIFDLASPLFI